VPCSIPDHAIYKKKKKKKIKMKEVKRGPFLETKTGVLGETKVKLKGPK